MARLRDYPSSETARSREDWSRSGTHESEDDGPTGTAELITHAEELMQNWLSRRQRTAEAAWDALSVMQPGRDPGAAMTAWMQWYRAALEELTEDTSDNLRFGCKAANCYGTLLTDGMQRVQQSVLRTGDSDTRKNNETVRNRQQG
ncbi:MAG TPA: hypothetical protein VFV47_13635 [Hyphomicrobiaceae bacterium]|nr:hypothetical protein [Hyphomicrobiaceae bacterium]